ncbi:hypothetical protein [Methyloterricola oryzae]|uniref:hypothetical protein n=1 Tax=Methyloterricola oryzae TaxID=1495050 RepID=UPI0005EBECF3|nr:hypothetical protein [Methyloterricola oryzae]
MPDVSPSPSAFPYRVLLVPVAVVAVTVLFTGCVSDAQFLAENSPGALRTAEARGKFELNCEQVTTSVLSQKIIQGIQGGYRAAGAWAGPWTQYTIGIRGCGREAVYETVCRDVENCNAFSQTARVLDAPQ